MYYNSGYGPASDTVAAYRLDQQDLPGDGRLLLAYPGSTRPPEASTYERLLHLLLHDKNVSTTLWRKATLKNSANVIQIGGRPQHVSFFAEGRGIFGEVGLAIASMEFGRNGPATMYTARVLELLTFGSLPVLYDALARPNEYIEFIDTAYMGVSM